MFVDWSVCRTINLAHNHPIQLQLFLSLPFASVLFDSKISAHQIVCSNPLVLFELKVQNECLNERLLTYSNRRIRGTL